MSKFCPSCGEELVDTAKFCKNCGMNLETREETKNTTGTQQTATPRYEVQKVENDHKIAVILGYICAILIPLFGLIFGIYLVTRNDSDGANMHGKFIIGLALLIWFISFLLIR
ncbi:zinc-ribbon domain-containing protein [uncultured Methanobrevibacter sp.]|uniref:zinc-ribbon domain-containing protein n=1 Tax=uncultured Methanobrevibacter sp. TaxID=253161 RepID=UPI0025DE7B62|nr:zinc-ribbon domain-containing protein [uncultured Methanobrevibacter sp.]